MTLRKRSILLLGVVYFVIIGLIYFLFKPIPEFHAEIVRFDTLYQRYQGSNIYFKNLKIYSKEYLDIALFGEDSDELEESRARVRASFKDWRALLAGSKSEDIWMFSSIENLQDHLFSLSDISVKESDAIQAFLDQESVLSEHTLAVISAIDIELMTSSNTLRFRAGGVSSLFSNDLNSLINQLQLDLDQTRAAKLVLSNLNMEINQQVKSFTLSDSNTLSRQKLNLTSASISNWLSTSPSALERQVILIIQARHEALASTVLTVATDTMSKDELVQIFEIEVESTRDDINRLLDTYLDKKETELEQTLFQMREMSQQTTLMVSAVGMVLLFLIFLIGFLIDRYFMKPVFKMTEAVEELANMENTADQLPEMGDNELGRLAQSFNKMILALHNRNHQLNHQRNWLETTLGSIGDGVLVTNEFGIISFINHRAAVILGLAREQAMEQHIDKIYVLYSEKEHGVVLDNPVMQLVDYPASSGQLGFGWLLIHSGIRIPIENSTAAIFNDTTLIGVVLIFRDISKRKEDEAVLLQEKQAAESATRAKSEFLATMSHEIRTPMNGVLGMAQLMLDTPLNVMQKRYLGTIIQSGELLINVINDILDFSKIESGRITIKHSTFELRHLIDDVMMMLKSKADQQKLGFFAVVNADVPDRVSGDGERLRQILINLVSNGLKFTHHGEVSVWVMQKEPGFVRFEVRDTGLGIGAEHQEFIFEPFSQVDTGTARHYEGTGLGLAICNRLVQAIGGRIEVRSKRDQGSTFSVDIPLQIMQADKQMKPDRSRALVCSFNQGERSAVREMLKFNGMKVTVCHGGFELMEQKIVKEHFDVIVLDENLENPSVQELLNMMMLRPGMRSAHIWIIGSCRVVSELNVTEMTKPVMQGFPAFYFRQNRTPVESRRKETEKSRKCMVLIVEDNVTNQQVLGEMLSGMGISHVLAESGEAAVEASLQQTFDLILMDCMMPGIGGFEASRQIRSGQGPNANVPIVAVTARTSNSDRETCFEVGMNDFVVKPYSKERVQEIINKYVTGLID